MIVTVEVATPFATTGPVPVIVEFTAAAAPATKPTVPVTVVNPAGVVMLNVFVSAIVDLIVPVATPEASVTAAAWVSVFPVPVEAKTTVRPSIGFPDESFKVIVTVEAATPSAVTPVVGERVSVEVALEGVPGRKPTVVVTAPSPAGEVMFNVFVSAKVEAIAPEVCPDPFVATEGWVSVFPVPVAPNVGVIPEIGLLFASRRSIVTAESAEPSARTFVAGDAEIAEVAAEGAPGTKVTEVVTVPSPAGEAMLTVFAWATVEAIVAVATPEAFVTAAGWVSVFPVPVEAIVVVTPFAGLLFASRSVIVIVEVATPFAVIPVAGAAEIVEFAAVAAPAMKETVPPVMRSGVVIERVFVSALSDLRVQVATPEALVAEQAP